MKRLSIGGFTAAGVLVLALGAGAVGGMVGAASGADPAPAQQPVTVDHVAEETTPSATPTPTAAPVESAAPAQEPVSDPAPIVDTMPKPETAAEAADRAKAEADRAKSEADRARAEAEKAATPAPAPVEGTGTAPKSPISSEEEQAAKEAVQHSWPNPTPTVAPPKPATADVPQDQTH